MSEREDVRFIQGDALAVLKTLPEESVHLCVCSPPYWNLRDYSCAGQLGLEPTPEEHILRLVAVFREVRRVLRRDGVLAVNYGDCYAGSTQSGGAAQNRGAGGKRRLIEQLGPNGNVSVGVPAGLKPKDLVGMPFRLALALQADGWWWRSCLPWVKRSAMPESCTDRPSTALEYVLLFAKSERYYWDADAVRRKAEVRNYPTWEQRKSDGAAIRRGDPGQSGDRCHWAGIGVNPNGRNLRNSDFYFDSLDLAIEQAKAELAHLTHLRERGGLLLRQGEPLALDVNTEAQKLNHFACFPRKLVAPLIQAGTSERGVCAECGSPWVRHTEKQDSGKRQKMADSWDTGSGGHGSFHRNGREKGEAGVPVMESVTLGWRKSCRCETEAVTPAVVLDPFAGTGTTLLVANNLGRRAIGIDLKDDYLAMARRRNAQVSLLL